MRTTNLFTRSVIAVGLASALSITAEGQDPRGIFISSTANAGGGAAHPALKFRIELDRAGRSEPVPTTYRFRSGDRFRFSFELNSSRYIYIVNRSVEGDPDKMGPLLGTRGINVVNQGSAAGPSTPGAPKLQLLWPHGGGNAQVAGNRPQTIPGATQFFEFDANPGMEKISLLVSPYPVDPGVYFPALGRHARPPAPGGRLDTNEDVLAQLNDLRSMDANTTTDPGVSRGICVGDCSQYSAPKDPAQPFIVTVDLMHTR